MAKNAKCNDCEEPTKYVVGFFDGKNGIHGCLYDCHNEECPIKQIMEVSASKDLQERAKIQIANGNKGMYAGYIAALRRCPCSRWHRLQTVTQRNTVHMKMSGKNLILKFTGNA